MHLRTRFCVVLMAALSIPTLALADTTIAGERNGAFFRITVPTVWNGDLVINNHGHEFTPPAPNPSLGDLAPLMLAEGYAVAASSYSKCCWTLFTTQKDLNNRLLGVFEDNFGAPDEVIVHGGSLGGIVSAQAVEKLDIPPVGAYPVCGAVAGSRVWDGALDLRLVYDAVCGAVGALPGGATGLPAPGFPPGLTVGAIAGAVNACTGVLLPALFRTAAQQARLNQFLAVTQLPENFVVTDMVFATNSFSNLIFAPDKLGGGQGVGNIGVTYNDPGIDATIQRVASTNLSRKRLKKYYTPNGDVGATKIVSIHTDGDGLVIVENEKEYQDVVPASNLSVAIVDEVVASHCGFTSPEVVAGWEELRDWIAGGPQPTAQDIQNRCLTLGPPAMCRINPAYVLNDMDTRIPPR